MEGMLSPADIAVLSGNRNGGNNGNNSGFGEGGWAWIIVLFLIFGYWRNGFGGNNGNGTDGSGAAMNYVLNSDFATLQRLIESGFDRVSTGINQVNNGLCNGFYEMASQFNTTNTNIMQGNFGLQNAINGVGTQLQSCCCELGRGQDQINYNLAMNSNSIQNTICNSTRDIIDSQNNGTRAILDAITANRIEDKNSQIQALQAQLSNAELRASQEAQTNYLYTSITDKLSPCPRPSYLVCNPNAPLNYGVYTNSGCGCGNY